MNKGVRAIGKERVVKLLRHFGNGYSVPIVSVGSGMGAIESMASDVKGGWVCVDPDWKSYHTGQVVHEGLAEEHRKPFIVPEYPLVKQLVKARPEIVGNCCVFLNWCDPNESDYDAEAVDLLRPIGIMTVMERFGESYGAAGGERFHALYEQSLTDGGPYTRFYETRAEVETESWIIGNLDIRLVWLHRRDHVLPDLPHAIEQEEPKWEEKFPEIYALLSLKMLGLKY